MHFTKFIYYLYGWDAGAWCNISKWKFCGFHLDDWMNPENCIVSWSTGLVFLSNQFGQDLEARKFYHEDFCIGPCYLNSFFTPSLIDAEVACILAPDLNFIYSNLRSKCISPQHLSTEM